MRKLLFLVLLAPVLSLHAQKARTLADTVAQFDAYVQKSMKDWEVPGMAIVVVRNGDVVYRKAYGTRQLGSGKMVDENTLFACASTTKAMTATAMGILVDQGKVKWDDPVIKYLPGFKLYDAYVTRDIRVRDLFLHNSGVGNTDFLWNFNSVTADEIVDRMQYVQPSYPYRAGFIYQNIFYLIAGKVIEKVSGQSWGDFVTGNIFKPLGMDRTRTTITSLPDDDFSHPHFRIDNVITPILFDTADGIGPAGSVRSSIKDISLWIKAMVDSSKYPGGRLVKPDTWMELLKPQNFVDEDGFYPTARLTKPHWTTYGLGWFQQDYKGQKLNFHTGSLAGEIAITGQIPDKHIAVYVFANLDHAEMRHALMFRALDQFSLGVDHDWNAEFLGLYGGIKKEAEARKTEKEAKRVMGTKPSLPLASYTGTYADKLYGSIRIYESNGQLQAIMDERATGKLEHWNYDTFRLVFDHAWNGKAWVQFHLDTDGKVDYLDAEGEVFAKKK